MGKGQICNESMHSRWDIIKFGNESMHSRWDIIKFGKVIYPVHGSGILSSYGIYRKF